MRMGLCMCVVFIPKMLLSFKGTLLSVVIIIVLVATLFIPLPFTTNAQSLFCNGLTLTLT